MTERPREIDIEGLEARIAAMPGVEAIRKAAAKAGVEAYLVGGAVRDALLGRDRADLDVAVVGDHLALAAALGGEVRAHDRFGTACVSAASGRVDIARARTETYPRPGALPEVRPAGIEEDLARRDFTINALAVPLRGAFSLLDPHGGVEDLRAGVLRLLHERSIADDPTRALRAARYASRFGLEPDERSLTLIRDADLGTVSEERVETELRLLAADEDPARGFELLDRWGLVALPEGGAERIEAVVALLESERWSAVAPRADAVLAARARPSPEVESLARVAPDRPSEAVAAARGRSPVELVLARAIGARWLDRYVDEWRDVRLSISGADLLAEGLAPGPSIGAGLAAALRAKLDGETAGREDELRIALAAAAGD